MPTRKLPDDQTVLRMYEGGMTLSGIAAMYGCHKQAVSWAVERAGGKGRETSSGYMPTGLKPEHYHAPAARHLRELSRRERAGEPKVRPLKPVEETGLNNWLAMLEAEGLAVGYDPEAAPNPASPTYGGWYYLSRKYAKPGKVIAYDPA